MNTEAAREFVDSIEGIVAETINLANLGGPRLDGMHHLARSRTKKRLTAHKESAAATLLQLMEGQA